MCYTLKATCIRLACRRQNRTLIIILVLLVLTLTFSFGRYVSWGWTATGDNYGEGPGQDPESECRPRPLSPERTSSSPTCQIPTFDPFSPCIQKHVEPFEEVVCGKEGAKFSFHMDFTSVEQPVLVQDGGGSASQCCYKAHTYKKEYDYERIPNEEPCRELSPTRYTGIPPEVEYIHLTCSKSWWSTETVHEEYFHIVRRKQAEVKVKSKGSPERNPSVLVIGLDTQSRMNFARHMPRSHAFLTQSLGAIDMAGFTKVGDATFNNTLAYLLGLSFPEVWTTCWTSTTAFFDACPFIWKLFADKGYGTSFAEEWDGVFNYRFKGFRNQPTDYYLHPFQHDLDSDETYATTYGLCFGPKFRFDILMSNIQQLAMVHRDSPYFQFAWSSGLNLGSLNGPLSTDAFLEKTLVFLSENALLENTILVLISDHGFRTGPVMYEFQGRVENRMPLTYFVLPKQFKEKYSPAVRAMLANQNRLTTPYDVFETLVDLSDLSSISSESVIEARRSRLESNKQQRGISLFLPIPLNRTCSEAGIDEQWCICNPYAILTPAEMEPCALIGTLAEVVVSTLNNWVLEYPRCAQFSLSHVIQTEVLLNENYVKTDVTCAEVTSSQIFHTFRIILSVLPSYAEFEAVLHRDPATGGFEMSTEIARINIYGDDAACISEYKLKKICYCSLFRYFMKTGAALSMIFVTCTLLSCFIYFFSRRTKAAQLKQ